MTALKDYQKLECTGLWRDTPDAQRREVMVLFGDATLVVSDGRSDRPLAHWSLPAVQRLNPGERPALFAPGPGAGETLEIEDGTMIDALMRVHALIEARRPHPGRLRFLIVGVFAATILGGLVFWLPRALIDHTVSVVPLSKRQEIGRAVLADLTRLTGTPCGTPEGTDALRQLKLRLVGSTVDDFIVVPEGVTDVEALPGRIFVIGRNLVEAPDSAEALGGHLLAAGLRAELRDPLDSLLTWAGPRASFELLTTGDLPPGTVTGYAETLLTARKPALPEAELLIRFAGAGLSTRAYAADIDPEGTRTRALIEGDPGDDPGAPILDDDAWVALQGICGS